MARLTRGTRGAAYGRVVVAGVPSAATRSWMLCWSAANPCVMHAVIARASVLIWAAAPFMFRGANG